MTRKYLVVDDNLEFAENVAEILTDAGADVCVAAEGQQALEQLRCTRFDGVVTDMKMPGLSGAQLLKQVREFDPGVPVVLLSAWAPDTQVLEARRLGPLAFLSKASGTPRLLELLEHARRDATVLLVEDDHSLVENLTEVLNQHGFTVCAASTMHELDALAVTPFVALVDLRVAGAEDGESLRRVRERYPGTPVVVITALRDFQPGPEVRLLRKPFDTSTLVHTLESLAQKAGHG
jgi:DNA-binding NtrC family response regulator